LTNRNPTLNQLARAVPRLLAGFCAALLLLVAAPAQAQRLNEGTGEVTLNVRSLGLGGAVRAGDWIGILLDISDSADRQREVLVRLTTPDADGDRVHYERTLTTNPGVPQPLWVYMRVPYRFKSGDQIHASVFTAVEQAAEAPAAGPDRRGWTYGTGRLLGTSRIILSPANLVPRTEAIFGIIGQRGMGLSRYSGDPGDSPTFMRGGHERTRLVTSLRPESLPDRWMGLDPFETVFWSEGTPAALGTERAAALREWVIRGGHLVIVLPRVGQTWTDEVNNPIHDIMPRVRVQRHEGVDLEPYRILISRDDQREMPRSEVVQFLHSVDGAAKHEAMCIIGGPLDEAGRASCLVARRLVGAGMVTMVGLDVASAWMSRNDFPEPELFWHRIIGKRGELHRLSQADRLKGGFESRAELTVDRDIKNEIAKTGLASSGVLIGFVVFVAYWLVAGPLGYAVLNRTGNKRHAWVAFVLAAAIFTGIAWGGARAIRPGSIETSHLTLLDHVYGQDYDRARSWVSLLIPDYGEAAVALGNPAHSTGRFMNAIAPWDGEDTAGDGFPDSRSYRIESRRPDLMVIPTRSTVKQFQLDWAGGPPWRMPRPVPTSTGSDGELRIIDQDGKKSISGVLVHDLPDTLTDVYIIVNYGQKDLLRSFAGPGARSMTADVATYRITSWEAGAPLDLGAQLEPVREKLDIFTELLSRIGAPDSQLTGTDPSRAGNRLTALSFFSQLQPPDARPPTNIRSTNPEITVQRRHTHGWDLGKWFTQPCIIVVGQIGADGRGPSPVPLYVARGGTYREVPQVGRTMVRWIYPLGERPPHPKPAEEDDSDSEVGPPG
jgi:hypothetical protein